MHTMTRFDKLRAFMVGHRIMWKEVANTLCITESGCRMACQRDRIKKIHHKKLLELGFPEDVLPIPNMRDYHEAYNSQVSQIAT